MKIYEVSYVRIKNLNPNEVKIAFIKWFKKYDIVRVTNVPLVNFHLSIIKDFLRRVLEVDRIQMTEINMALQYFDLALKSKKQEPISPTIIPGTVVAVPSLQKHPKKCDSVYGKSSGYGDYIVIEWDKEVEVNNSNDQDMRLIQEVKNFVKEFPYHTSQGFDDSVKMHNATFAKLGCFIASYLTSCDYQVTEDKVMQKILDELIAADILSDKNTVDLRTVNFLHSNRALVATFDDNYVLDHHIVGRLGSLTLNNRVNEIARIQDVDVVHQICAIVETVLLIAAPFLYLKGLKKSNNLISFKGVQVNNDQAGYAIALESTIKEVLSSMVMTMNTLNVEELLNVLLNEYISSDNAEYKIEPQQVKALYDIILSFRRSIHNSCIEYETTGGKQHLTVLYPMAVDGHNVTFDPRWSGCNCGVKYDEDKKNGTIVYDLLYDSDEYHSYLKKLKVKVKNERFVLDLIKSKVFLKWRSLVLKELKKYENMKNITPYHRALSIIRSELTEPVMSKKHYSSTKGSLANVTSLDKLLVGEMSIAELSTPNEVEYV